MPEFVLYKCHEFLIMPTKRHTISLSKHLDLTRKKLEKIGVFDATLGVDTRLFIDPKLLIRSKIPEFKTSRYKILKHFAKLIRIHKLSTKSSQLGEIALSMLAVPEPQGLAIGYGHTTDRGVAISESIARKILLQLSEMMSVGLQDKELVELMALFVKGFASDSISDLSAHIIYDDLCRYTERIAKKLKVETTLFDVGDKKYQLPKHPFKNSQVIFVPHTLLSPLPVATSWEEIEAAAAHNRKLRKTFSEIVKPSVYAAIKDLERLNPEEREDFKSAIEKLVEVYQGIRVSTYSLRQDRKGYYGIQPFVDKEESNYIPSNLPTTAEELITSVREIITQYQKSIEHNAGNRLLYHRTKSGSILKNKPHNEDVAQNLFFQLADQYCSMANILLSREPNAGIGAVDFSLGKGYDSKILVEIKKSTNTGLESGYKKQITAYEKSESSKHSFFVVIIVKEGKKKKNEYPPQLQTVKNLYDSNVSKSISTPELFIIDGLIYPSPSKRREKSNTLS